MAAEVRGLALDISTLMISTDLLFGSLETHLAHGALTQAQSTGQSVKQAAQQGMLLFPDLESLFDGLGANLEKLVDEIEHFDRLTRDPTFGHANVSLEELDALSFKIVDYVTRIEERIAGDLERRRSGMQQNRSSFALGVGAAAFAYVVCILLVLAWGTKSVSLPVRQLAQAARNAVSDRASFEIREEGPTEVRELARHIGSFITSLEGEIGKTNALIDAIPDTLIVLDAKNRVTHINLASNTTDAIAELRLSEESLADLLGRSQLLRLGGELTQCRNQQCLRQFEMMFELDGIRRIYELRAMPIDRQNVAVVVRDLTDKIDAEKRIRHLAYHDGLTDLLNRRAFVERMEEFLRSNEHSRFTLLYLDADRFKSINDAYGHEAGDVVLQRIASALRLNLRADDTFIRILPARIGGDEFVVVLPGVIDSPAACAVADRLLQVVGTPVVVRDQRIKPSVSIGIAIYPEHGRCIEDLMNHADLAMFSAKRSGGARHAVYHPHMGEKNRRRLTLETRLRRAIDRDDLFVAYQPKYRLSVTEITGAEALVRWRDGDQIVSPSEFIPVAESSGLVEAIGELVLEKVADQIAVWRSDGLNIPHVAVNFSAPQFKSSGAIDRVLATVRRHAIKSSDICVEITETMFLDEFDLSVKILQELHELGFLIALDDFGTGYSSLSYLQRLPLDILKIDRRFVATLTPDSREQAIARTIVTLGHSLNLRVVAEGVENNQQAELLTAMTCDEAQGYLYAKPLLPDELSSLYQAERPDTVSNANVAALALGN